MEDRKTQIIEIAIELIKKYGYDSFSYADLSKTLGITKASIHHHFSKKDDLGLALCFHIHKQMLDEFNSIMSKETSAKNKLFNYFNLYEKIIEDGDKICPIASLQAEANIISQEMRNKINVIDDSESEFVEKILNIGIASGEFNKVGNMKIEATLIASTLKGALQYARIHGKEHYKMIVEQLVLHFVNHNIGYSK